MPGRELNVVLNIDCALPSHVVEDHRDSGGHDHPRNVLRAGPQRLSPASGKNCRSFRSRRSLEELCHRKTGTVRLLRSRVPDMRCPFIPDYRFCTDAAGLALVEAVLVFVKSSLVFSYLLKTVLLISLGAAEDTQSLRSSVVQIGGCSGVCVDPAGLIMTAKHCELQNVETVRVGDQEHLAFRIYEAPGTEGPLVYDCFGGGFSWTPVATEKPEPGQRVRTMGFPAINGVRQFRESSGIVEGGAKVWFEGEQFLGNLTDMELTPGWSGGPLFNGNGEVVGLANSSGVGVGSVFISYAATLEAWQAVHAIHNSRPLLQILVATDHKQSLTFQHDFEGDLDFQRELREHFRLLFLDAQQPHPALGDLSKSELPAFVMPNGDVITGYRGQLDLLMRLYEHRRAHPGQILQEW